jgi:hypothetical protein
MSFPDTWLISDVPGNFAVGLISEHLQAIFERKAVDRLTLGRFIAMFVQTRGIGILEWHEGMANLTGQDYVVLLRTSKVDMSRGLAQTRFLVISLS